MRMIAVFCCFLVALLPAARACAAASAGQALWRMAPRDSWVRDAPAAGAAAAVANGLLLHDRQIRITASGDARYEHSLQYVAAAQAAGLTRLDLTLDPRFQDLIVHALRLLHADASRTEFTAAQLANQLHLQSAEAEPRKRALDPRVQVRIEVPGTRAGDLLEFEYTVQSRASGQPGLAAGHYAAVWTCGGDQPVQLERLRVTWPAGRTLRFRFSSGARAAAPRIHSDAGALEVLWQDLQPPVAEEDTPRGFEPRGTVQLSDYADWTQVAAVLAPSYAPGAVPAAGAPGSILDIERRVQTRVQPVAVSGTGLYDPAAPALVWQRGYGDGRDIARLLVSLLRAGGLDAEVALGDSRGGLPQSSLPSPFGLDAALVRVRAGPQEYWLNPMAAGPAEVLERTDPADLRQVLLIAAADGRVVALPPPAPDSRLRIVTQQFDLRAGNARPAALTLTTQFRGRWAAAARAQLRGQTAAQLQLNQIQSVVQDYPAATADGAVTVADVPAEQLLQISARFRIPAPLGDPGAPQFSFFAEALSDAVQPRDEATRQLPLGLPWPLQEEEHIVAALPPGFVIAPGVLVIETAAFRYQRDVRFAAGTVRIDHRYVARTDHVDPADYPAFLEANARVYQSLGMRVRPAGLAPGAALDWLATHWLAVGLVAALAVSAADGWRRLRRRA